MKAIFIILSVIVSTTHAEVKAPEVRQRTSEGKAQTISVGSCSMPSLYFSNMESNFTYTVCQQHITADYEVTGSSWNKKYALIPGTEKISYSIVQKSNGSSLYYDNENDNWALKYLEVSSNCNSLRRATELSVVDVSQTSCVHPQ